MRAMLLTVAMLALGACATEGPSRYQQEVDRLAAECAAKGGVLTPTGNHNTGNPALENACLMQSGRITR